MVRSYFSSLWYSNVHFFLCESHFILKCAICTILQLCHYSMCHFLDVLLWPIWPYMHMWTCMHVWTREHVCMHVMYVWTCEHACMYVHWSTQERESRVGQLPDYHCHRSQGTLLVSPGKGMHMSHSVNANHCQSLSLSINTAQSCPKLLQLCACMCARVCMRACVRLVELVPTLQT